MKRRLNTDNRRDSVWEMMSVTPKAHWKKKKSVGRLTIRTRWGYSKKKKKKEKQSKLRKPCMAKECKNIIGKDSIILRDDRKCNYPASL